MDKSVFNPDFQHKNIAGKVIAGFERISEVFKILLWEKAKLIGLSPIQIQILLFISYHRQELSKVSHLAKEFNVTKPTISDAIKILNKKELIIKDYSSTDSRSYSIQLSKAGEKIVSETYDFANPLKDHLTKLPKEDVEGLFSTLSQLIYKLNRTGILSVQRTCYGCKFYQKNRQSDFCTLLEKELTPTDIRLDCPEFEIKPTGSD